MAQWLVGWLVDTIDTQTKKGKNSTLVRLHNITVQILIN